MALKIEKIIHEGFELGILLKALNGLFEIIGGSLLLLIKSKSIQQFVSFITQNELAEDQNDLVANYLINLANQLSIDGKIFLSLFLLSHGVIKLFLVIALWKKKLWAYPTAIAIFALFVVYQIYRYIYHPTFGLIILTILDLAIIGLTSLEYRRIKKHQTSNPNTNVSEKINKT